MSKEPELKYNAMVIDTSIFDAHGLKLETGILKRLFKFTDGPMDLVLPDIVIYELKAHLLKNAKSTTSELISKIKKSLEQDIIKGDFFKKEPIKMLQEIDLEKQVEDKIDRFINSTGSISLNTDEYVSTKELTQKYFSNSSPFSETGKKKNEFPDAIALIAVENWSKENKKKTLVISKDNDWKGFCEDSNSMEYDSDLAKGIEILHDANKYFSIKEEFSDMILQDSAKDEINEIRSFIDILLDSFEFDFEAGSDWIFEKDSLSWELFDFNFVTDENGLLDLPIVDFDENKYITLKASIEIEMEFEAGFSFSIRDSVDKDYIDIGSTYKNTTETQAADILITLAGELDDGMEGLVVHDLELDLIPIIVEFGYIEPEIR